jgi:hypothetical protein
MKAVFSFWNTTGNTLTKATNWSNPKFHLYSWVLAVHQAKKYYNQVELVTDTASLEMFKELQLPFTSIRTDLDELIHYPKSLWALGKLKAYQIQTEPFVHIDNDFILYKPLPSWFSDKKIGFQNKEGDDWFETQYRNQYEHLTKNGSNLPESWDADKYAFNCGVYLCNDLEYNQRYCKEAFQLVDNNVELIKETGCAGLYCIIFEQYVASAVAQKMNIEPAYLADPFSSEEIEKLGLIHIWGAKNDEKWFQNIERIVKNEHPKHFEIIGSLYR